MKYKQKKGTKKYDTRIHEALVYKLYNKLVYIMREGFPEECLFTYPLEASRVYRDVHRRILKVKDI